MPGLGDSISEGVVEALVKGPGEYVAADETIARIETDKVTVDIPSPSSGVITEYMVEEGDTVDVGADFFKIDTDAKAPEGGAAPKETPAAAEAKAPEPATPAAPKSTPTPPKAEATPAPTPAAGGTIQ